jgi:hypothetical protein
LKGVKTDKYADQHRVPEQFPATPFWTGGQSTTSRMECLSLFLEMLTVMQITAGSDEKQHVLEEKGSARVTKGNNRVRNVASPGS